MYSTKYSLIGLILILVMVLSTFAAAIQVSAASTGLVVYSPTADNATNMAYVKAGGIVSITYNLQGAGGDSNPMQFHIYPTSGPDIGAAYPDRASGATYTDNVSIAGGASEGTYNLSAYDGANPIVVKLGAVKVDNTAPTGSLLIPTASTVWKGGSSQSIYWTSADAADSTQNVYVTLDYYNGTTWANIITNQSYLQGQQSYAWTVAAADSTACQIRMYLTDRAGNTSTVITGPTFTILNTAPTIVVTYPDAAGITWTSGAAASITWTVAGSIAPTLNYVLKYDIAGGGGGYPYTIATLNGRTRVATDNYSSFTAPYVAYASRNLLRVKVIATDSAGNTGNDASDNNFAVNDTTAPSVTLGAPNGGQNWLAGSVQNITFTMSDLSGDNLNYELQYTTNASDVTPIWTPVTGGTGTNVAQGAKTVAWTVPAPTVTSTACKVRVKVTNQYSVASAWIASTSAFTITVSTTPPVVAVITPNGGETLVGGTAYNITYTATDSVSGTFQWLKFEYTLNNGGGWTTITTINNAPQAASGSGTFVWSVPNSPATECRIRVTAHSQTGLETLDQSDNLFEITASTFAPTTANINMYRGWNLISLQLIPVNSNIGSVMASVADKVSSVWYYDTTNGWQSWKPGAPSDLTISRDGKAYWVNLTDNATLTFSGRVGPEPPDVMPTYTVAAGWNMVGFKSLANQAANAYLAPLTSTSIYWFDNTGGTGYQRIATGADLNPAKGYWVYFGTGGSFAP